VIAAIRLWHPWTSDPLFNINLLDSRGYKDQKPCMDNSVGKITETKKASASFDTANFTSYSQWESNIKSYSFWVISFCSFTFLIVTFR
jgi:phosphodiesterase/alkaline phosphatase D-like protein